MELSEWGGREGPAGVGGVEEHDQDIVYEKIFSMIKKKKND